MKKISVVLCLIFILSCSGQKNNISRKKQKPESKKSRISQKKKIRSNIIVKKKKFVKTNLKPETKKQKQRGVKKKIVYKKKPVNKVKKQPKTKKVMVGKKLKPEKKQKLTKTTENKKTKPVKKKIQISKKKQKPGIKIKKFIYKTKNYRTKYISYKIGKRVTYRIKLLWIKRRLLYVSKKLKIPVKNLIPFKMGRSVVFVEQLIKPGSDITYFFVHPNELTAYIALKKHINKYGGRAFLFISSGKHFTARIRYLIYKVKRFPFALDANRIYTDRRTIKNEFLKVGYIRKFWANNIWYWRKYANHIKNAVWKISFFYKYLAMVSPDPIVGVHDNQGLFWVRDIFRGRNRYRIASRWYKKWRSWHADFVYVIRKKDFNYFKSQGINVILQDNKRVPNDGSMSVYFSRKKRWYMCIETGRIGIAKRLGKALFMLRKMRNYIISVKKQKITKRVYAE